jgi:hypothetical protein
MLHCSNDRKSRRVACVAELAKALISAQQKAARGPLAGLACCAVGSSQSCVQALGGYVVVVLQLVFVTANLAVQFVHQLVNRGIHVLVGRFDKDVFAFRVQGDLGFLAAFLFSQLLKRQQHRDVYHLVKVPSHAV